MKAYIANIQDINMIDYLGEVASAVFFAGCNLRCRYCYNSLILKFERKFLKEVDYLKNKIMRNLPLIGAIIFSGGEPLLQEKPLVEMCEWAVEKGLKIGIETNGSKPVILEKLLDMKLLNFIAMDVKAPLHRYEEVVQIDGSVVENLRESINIVKRSRIDYEFRTTFVPGLVDIDDINGIYEIVGQHRWVWQKYRHDIGEILDKKLVEKSFSSEKTKKFESLSKQFINAILRF